MKINFILFYLLVSPFLIVAQKRYSFQVDSCLYQMDVNKVGKGNSKFNYLLNVQINNYSKTTKYFLQRNNDTTVTVNYSDYYLNTKSISFYIGSCIEDRFPYLCSSDTFKIFSLEPNTSTNSKCYFNSKLNINQLTEHNELIFYLRLLNSPIPEIKNGSIHIVTYTKQSSFFKIILNSQKRKREITRKESKDE